MSAEAALSRLFSVGRSGWMRLVDFVLPPVCLVCRQPVGEAHGLCATCWSELAFIERPYCERLGIPFAYDIGPGALSAQAIAAPPVYDRARSAVLYQGVARDLVADLKYRDRTEVAPLLGRLTARAARDLKDGAQLLIPVPLHRRRLIWRRFNQSALIAAVVAREIGVALETAALVRVRATTPQVGLKGNERADNVAGAFQVTAQGAAHVAGRNVILVDDVVTTGATVAAAARALKRAGAARVDVLSFARATPGADTALPLVAETQG
jgi:ComF family protein